MTFVFRKGVSFLSILLAAGIFFVLTYAPGLVWLSGFLAILCVLQSSLQMHDVLATFFNGKKSVFTWLIAVLASLFVISALGGAFLVVTQLTPIVIALIFALAGILVATFSSWAAPSFDDAVSQVTFEIPVGLSSSFGVVAYLILAVSAIYYLTGSPASASILNPWQVINPQFLYFFGAATAVLGLLIFTRLRVTTVLFLLCVHTFILHSYLPLTHELFYGADGWRHIGYIDSIVHEQPIISAELSDAPSIGARLGVVAYGQFWTLAALVSRLFGVNSITIMTWLLPVLWSLTIPFILYRFGEVLGLRRRASLIMVWLSFLPFALQAAGSFSLPVNLGFIFWLVSTLFVLERAKQPEHGQVGILFFFGLLSVFSYSLFCLLFWFSWVVVEIFLALRHSQPSVRRVGVVAVSFLGSMMIPAIELVTRYSHLPIKILWLTELRQLIGNFTAVYLATGPRPHDISTGNILFNQIPQSAFVSNDLLVHMWWLVPVAVVFWLLAFVGWCSIARKINVVHQWLTVFTVTCFGGYAISRYVLAGEQLFARRLDVVLAFVGLVLAVLAGQLIAQSLRGKAQLFAIVVLVVVGAVSIAASYSLGPDTDAVGSDEYQAMRYVWQEDKANELHCVIADTYPLLALEAISERKVIGGGFPIDQYYNQPELKRSWTGFHSQPNGQLWGRALATTHAPACWLLISGNRYIETAKEVGRFGTLKLWKFPNSY